VLTLDQTLLIHRIKAFSESPFIDTLFLDDKESAHYIATEEEFSLYMSIPSALMLCIAHIEVRLFEGSLSFLSGELVTPPLCAGIPSKCS